jgi:tetratricopeptide (TPR) repeat protein
VLFGQLEQQGFMSNAVTVIMGDHGESLGEHKELDHGYYVYDATVKIPLIMSWPGHLKSRIVTQQVREIDVLPTIAELVGFQANGAVQGKSLSRLMNGQQMDVQPAYFESYTPKLYYGWSELASIRSDHWKYIQAPEPELYNLKDDPNELHNLISERPDQARLLAEQLKKIIAMGQKAQDQKAEAMDADRLEQLASLGYIGATNPAAMLNSSSNIDPKSKIDDYLLHHKLIPQAIHNIDQANYENALQLLRTVEAKFNNSFVVYWYMGLCYAKLNQLENARKAYSHTIELNPYFGRAYTDLALTLQLQKKHQEALKLLDTIPNAAVSSTDRDFIRGELQMNEGNISEAERAYSSSLQSDPENTDTQYALARLYLATGRIDDAVTKMDELARIQYPSEDLYYALSAIYRRQGKEQETEKILQQWLQIYPQSSSACYQYGLFLAAKGDREQAISYLEKSIQIDPSKKEAAEALAAMKQSGS